MLSLFSAGYIGEYYTDLSCKGVVVLEIRMHALSKTDDVLSSIEIAFEVENLLKMPKLKCNRAWNVSIWNLKLRSFDILCSFVSWGPKS